ncbi:MAG: hypothetical protein A3F68_12100 [Acidobacteria bacterium RIFCSPLOWO2_12_FULL_54_10]|nr:MAG: hypothetical protein A3F68_12100 [Acidobacteria bacterium RIFCSPLOWO2_12_FULL_54_10]
MNVMTHRFSPVLAKAFLIVFLCSLTAFAQKNVIAKTDTAPKPAPAKRKVIAITAENPKPKPAKRRSPSRKVKLPTYGNPAIDDDQSSDDPVVRAAVQEALGKINGAVIVVQSDTGRVLSIVNQKLAFQDGYQPCSSFKPAVALAALSEGIISEESNSLQLGKRWKLDLDDALAQSNNLYFEKLGKTLGIEKLQWYAHQFGFGEQAGWGIQQEPPGGFPSEPPPAREGGVGKIASFGQGISMTLFQLVSFTAALANGGTLYYLQYPQPSDSVEGFVPRVKRYLHFGDSAGSIRRGMEQAVLAGTARRAKQPDVSIFGKTGTCSQGQARLGWFTGYSKDGLSVAVLLHTGLKIGGGPKASEIAGKIFRKLADKNYLAHFSPQPHLPTAPPALIQLTPQF